MCVLPDNLSGTVRLGSWKFHEIRMEDIDTYARYIRQTEYPANLWSSNFAYIWALSQSGRRTILWRIMDGMLVTFVYSHKGSLYLYCLPFGPGNAARVTALVTECMRFCYGWNGHDGGWTLIKMVSDQQLAFLRSCPDFDRTYRIAVWQGIERHVDVARLVTLSGKEFENIRNRVNKFRREHPDARISGYEPGDFEALMALGERWKSTAGQKYVSVFDGSYFPLLIQNSEKLRQSTLVVRIAERIVGMVSGGELPTGRSWGSLVKFDEGYPGLSETLIVEFARELHRNNPAVGTMNIGSDLGASGLRQYKLKFRPVLSCKRYQVYFRDDALPDGTADNPNR